MNVADVADSLSRAKASLRDELMPPHFHLPLVSIVIVNYNYGRYLAEAVDSVFAQTYANLECIIVNNASTDETPAVLATLGERYPSIIVINRAVNNGQTAASLAGLERSTGQYVIFLDADDVLLPRGIETHIYVHLSSRLHIGFTAGDMLQARNGDIVVATGEAMNRYIRGARKQSTNIWRPYRGEPGWPPSHIGDNLNLKARYVPPLCTTWIWTPTSGLCYRRDALLLFADNEHLPELWTATDMYFAHGIGGWCGSILIDEPVFIYRLHGSNLFSQTAQLQNKLNYQPGGSGDYNDAALGLIVDQFVSHCERFSQNLLLKIHLIMLLFGLNGAEGDQRLPCWAKRSRSAHRLVMHFDRFAARFGRPLTYLLMAIFRVPLHVMIACRRQSGPPPQTP
jgi:glycosyltransferase involved in cell wall biosynthesis